MLVRPGPDEGHELAFVSTGHLPTADSVKAHPVCDFVAPARSRPAASGSGGWLGVIEKTL
jgi:hypothetical protein